MADKRINRKRNLRRADQGAKKGEHEEDIRSQPPSYTTCNGIKKTVYRIEKHKSLEVKGR